MRSALSQQATAKEGKVSDLIKRLREDYEFRVSIVSLSYRETVSRLPVEAADAIEAANARIAELEAITQAPRGTNAQILMERKLTCEQIDGAMAFGYQNTNPPPSDDHWLAPFWKIGRQHGELESRLAANGADSASPTLNEGEQAMQDACATLPGGYLIEVNLENGAGWVDLYYDGEKVEFDEDTDDGMTGRIREATAAAIAASAEKEESIRAC
jgi:hypothetical protein